MRIFMTYLLVIIFVLSFTNPVFAEDNSVLYDYCEEEILRDGPAPNLVCPSCHIERPHTYKPVDGNMHNICCNICNYPTGSGTHVGVINGVYMMCAKCNYILYKI